MIDNQDFGFVKEDGEPVGAADVQLPRGGIAYDFPLYVETMQRVARERFADLGVDPATLRIPTDVDGHSIDLDGWVMQACVNYEIHSLLDVVKQDYLDITHSLGKRSFWKLFTKDDPA